MAEEDQSLQMTLPFALTPTLRRDPYPYISTDNPSNTQHGKIILVTGGGSGIGAAAAKVWARAGAMGVVITGRRAERLEQTAAAIRATNKETKVLAVPTDVSDDAAIAKLHEKVRETFGRPADVILACAGMIPPAGKVGEVGVEDWWTSFGLLKGLYSLVHYWIKSQKDPANPEGTFISVSGGLSAWLFPGVSSLGVTKLAGNRLIEFIQAEYPSLRAFTLLPGLVQTEPLAGSFLESFAGDHADLTGLVSLWLTQPKADFMKGRTAHVNWDFQELEQHAEEIQKEDLLRVRAIPGIPVSGGTRFSK